MTYAPARRPTLYFIGVSTGRSSIMRVFPAWAEHLGLKDAVIRGIDFPVHAEPAAYREAVQFIKANPLSLGALVTTHKIDLFQSCRDLFDLVDPHAAETGEASCISKEGGKLVAHAKDPITSGLAIEGFLPADHFAQSGAETFVIGAGGSAIAISSYLMRREPGDRPGRIVISDRDRARLDAVRGIHAKIGQDVPIEYVAAVTAADNDAVVGHLKPGSLVVNATGLGKDAPGSPLTDAVSFPERGIVWELNYRGRLVFLDQARAQREKRHLQIEDGWTYFIHGWTRVIAEVFHVEIPASGPGFETLSRIAESAGRSPA